MPTEKAIDVMPQNVDAWMAMVEDFSVLSLNVVRRAVRFAETGGCDIARQFGAVNACARVLYKTGEKWILERAIQWAQQAIAISKRCILPAHARFNSVRSRHLSKAVKSAQEYLADEDMVRRTVGRCRETCFVELAARVSRKGPASSNGFAIS